MSTLFVILILTLIGGLSMPLGGFIASLLSKYQTWHREEMFHGIIAFGGGTLISAVCLVLVPEGISNLTITYVALAFVLGGASFMVLDRYIQTKGGTGAQLMAMLLDFTPEAIALGALAMHDLNSAKLLAILIAIQNIPEAFNAYMELHAINLKALKILLLFFVMSFIGPISGLAGFLFLYEKPVIISFIMVFASGGILYLIFQDIAPASKLKRHWIPPMGAILGFLLGLLGKMLL